MQARDLALRAAAFGLVVAALPFVLYGQRHTADQFAVLLSVFVGAASVGGLLGFLFGLPKSGGTSRSADGTTYTANTNLEQISDWATKLILGATLAGAAGLGRSLHGFLADRVAPAMGGRSAYPLALFALIFGLCLGTIGGWLATRLALAGAMARSDLSLRETLEQLAEETPDPQVSEQLLQLAEDVVEPAIEPATAARALESRVRASIQRLLDRLSATIEPDQRLFDIVLSVGDIRIGIECKHVAKALTLSHLRFQRARLDARDPVDAIVLVTDGPIARNAETEANRLRNTHRLGLFPMTVSGVDQFDNYLAETIERAIAFATTDAT